MTNNPQTPDLTITDSNGKDCLFYSQRFESLYHTAIAALSGGTCPEPSFTLGLDFKCQ
jgi:hypothetical protein